MIGVFEEAGERVERKNYCVFEKYCKNKLITILVHLSDQLGKDLDTFGSA